jgi:hypothetical protein
MAQGAMAHFALSDLGAALLEQSGVSFARIGHR